MKRILLAVGALSLVLGAYALSGNPTTGPDLQVEVQGRNPWTHLRLNNDPESFHFVVVSDRTGGHRARIFSQAVEQINLLQPEFVVSVGDLIEGYSKDPDRLRSQWKEFQSYTSKLQMPFFYVPGNHDVANMVEASEWKDRFGRAYYHFLYRDTLFLAVNSDDPAEARGDKEQCRISPEQIDYFKKVLADNAKVRWIFVMLHKPMWVIGNMETNGWAAMEKLLEGRKYTVFAGHVHRYQKFVRQGMNYYQLATTGGGSKLRGVPYGEFDQIAWITVPKAGSPVMANVLLDGIYPESMKRSVTDEDGVFTERKATFRTRGLVTLNGAAVANALVAFHVPEDKEKKKFRRVADTLSEADGTFSMSTYTAFDGVPKGDYHVTVTLREPLFDLQGKPTPNRLPSQYADPATSGIIVSVQDPGPNSFDFSLVSK